MNEELRRLIEWGCWLGACSTKDDDVQVHLSGNVLLNHACDFYSSTLIPLVELTEARVQEECRKIEATIALQVGMHLDGAKTLMELL